MEHLTPKEAAEFLHRNPKALFVDCRSEMEFFFVGHPLGVAHVPWIEGPDWEINPHFVAEIRKLADDDHSLPVLLICRSGNRSVDGGNALEKGGFKRVFNVLYGFEGELDDNHHRGSQNGWRYEGLPWEQC